MTCNRTLLWIGIFIMSLSVISANAQSSELKKAKFSKIWISPADGSLEMKGFLRSIEDSLLVISNISKSKYDSIHIAEIESIKYRRKGRPLIGMFFGEVAAASAGLITAARYNFDRQDNFFRLNRLDVFVWTTIVASPVLIPIGAVLGIIKKKVPHHPTNNMVLLEYLEPLIVP